MGHATLANIPIFLPITEVKHTGNNGKTSSNNSNGTSFTDILQKTVKAKSNGKTDSPSQNVSLPVNLSELSLLTTETADDSPSQNSIKMIQLPKGSARIDEEGNLRISIEAIWKQIQKMKQDGEVTGEENAIIAALLSGEELTGELVNGSDLKKVNESHSDLSVFADEKKVPSNALIHTKIIEFMDEKAIGHSQGDGGKKNLSIQENASKIIDTGKVEAQEAKHAQLLELIKNIDPNKLDQISSLATEDSNSKIDAASLRELLSQLQQTAQSNNHSREGEEQTESDTKNVTSGKNNIQHVFHLLERLSEEGKLSADLKTESNQSNINVSDSKADKQEISFNAKSAERNETIKNLFDTIQAKSSDTTGSINKDDKLFAQNLSIDLSTSKSNGKQSLAEGKSEETGNKEIHIAKTDIVSDKKSLETETGKADPQVFQSARDLKNTLTTEQKQSGKNEKVIVLEGKAESQKSQTNSMKDSPDKVENNSTNSKSISSFLPEGKSELKKVEGEKIQGEMKNDPRSFLRSEIKSDERPSFQPSVKTNEANPEPKTEKTVEGKNEAKMFLVSTGEKGGENKFALMIDPEDIAKQDVNKNQLPLIFTQTKNTLDKGDLAEQQSIRDMMKSLGLMDLKLKEIGETEKGDNENNNEFSDKLTGKKEQKHLFNNKSEIANFTSSSERTEENTQRQMRANLDQTMLENMNDSKVLESASRPAVEQQTAPPSQQNTMSEAPSGVHTNDSNPVTRAEAINEPQASMSKSYAEQIQKYQDAASQQIVRAVHGAIGSGRSHVTFRLVPESLGNITVQLKMNNGVLNAHITAQNEQTRVMLEKGMATLRSAFDEQGIRVERLSIVKETTDSRPQNDAGKEDRSSNRSGGKSGADNGSRFGQESGRNGGSRRHAQDFPYWRSQTNSMDYFL